MNRLKVIFGFSIFILLATAVTVPLWDKGEKRVIEEENQSNIQNGSHGSDLSCIITISGEKYDVTRLRDTHEGGDIFKCGTDMTSKFFSEHNTKTLTNDLAPFKVE